MTKSIPGRGTKHRAQPHIVIVEDNGDVSDALEIVFRTSGYEVSVACTAAAAVKACRAIAARGAVADLMLLDLSLPDASGLEALQETADAGVQPRVTVAITGHADPHVAAVCRAAGCHDVVVKPVGVRDLVARAAAWME
jgi:DNA-binding response OmpR family regulator